MSTFVMDDFNKETEHWELVKVNQGLFEIRMNGQIVSSHSMKSVAEENFNEIKNHKFKDPIVPRLCHEHVPMDEPRMVLDGWKIRVCEICKCLYLL